METEFKIALADEGSFTRIREVLAQRGASEGSRCRQVNHFFDTPGKDLRAGHLALRLRDEEGKFLLTAKGETIRGSEDNALTTRPEVEAEIDEETASAVLQGGSSPLDVLEAALGEPRPTLIDRLNEAVGGQALVHLGCFENERLRPGAIHVELGGETVALEFELDRTRFPGGKVERELELELSDPAQGPAVEAWLRKVLAAAGIQWCTAASKAKRFFAALEADSD